jgi:hypothetical protein
MNTVETVGGMLRASIAKAKGAGWNIVRAHVRGPANASACCCAIGTVVTDVERGVPLYGEICERLGIGYGEAIAIARGFDGGEYNSDISTPDWHCLGKRLYEELQEGIL